MDAHPAGMRLPRPSAPPRPPHPPRIHPAGTLARGGICFPREENGNYSGGSRWDGASTPGTCGKGRGGTPGKSGINTWSHSRCFSKGETEAPCGTGKPPRGLGNPQRRKRYKTGKWPSCAVGGDPVAAALQPLAYFSLLDPTEGFSFLGKKEILPPAQLSDTSGVETGPEQGTSGAWAPSRCQNLSF